MIYVEPAVSLIVCRAAEIGRAPGHETLAGQAFSAHRMSATVMLAK
jgi:hypothetical protein